MASHMADYVVIGGGTAGLTLACRLSEDPQVSVLVLEAGRHTPDDPRVKIPALWPGLIGTEADWGYTSVPQKALFDKVIPIPHGRILGGSSAINGMAFVANSRINVDAWSHLGNPGWDWESMQKYYGKVYTLELPSEGLQDELGLQYVSDYSIQRKGPLHASFPDATGDPVASAWLASIRSLGYEMKMDPFAGSAWGGYTNAATIEPVSKTRSYSANAYYEPVKGRSNLTVVTGAYVEKILFDHPAPLNSPAAVGVEYEVDGSKQTAKAQREVILSAGAFQSPKILEHSGIGSKQILEANGLQVIYDNANVGENLQDHVLAGLSFEVRDTIQTKDDLMRREPEALKSAMENYKSKQSGPFTVGGNYSSALLPLFDYHAAEGQKVMQELTASNPPNSSYQKELHDYVLSLLQNPEEASGGFFAYPAQADFRGSGTAADVIKTKFPENYITICASFLHPLSRGSTHVVSSDPKEKPLIDPKYLTHPLDLDVLARHTRFIENIVEAEGLQAILKPGGKRSPGVPADLRKVPLDEVKDFVRTAAKSTWHPVGTCAMMPLEKGGVVDPQLRVYGVRGLRVADASIIPIIARGNTMTSVYAIAEKAADLVKESRAEQIWTILKT